VENLEPYRVDVAQKTLDDLAERLRRTRLPNEITGIGWEQGTSLAYLREVLRYWQDSYDWRAHEARINGFDQFTTTVEGQLIHFLHVRSPHPQAIPLMLTHGWPGSLVEFLDTIGPLTDPPDPADAFHVVVPSLPGYGFSGATTERGWNPRRIAAAFGEVMDRLGYDRYGVQGGDWGAIVSYNMAELRPDHVIGLHVNLMNVPPPDGEQPAPPTPWALRVGRAGGAYAFIQGARPQTIGYLLDDSPAGLAAWIIEKFQEWSDCDGDVERSFTKDQMLTNIMVYWVNRTGASSSRLYWERGQDPSTMIPQGRVNVPTGVANFPMELIRTERRHAEQYFNIVHWTELPRGGHFASMEVPDIFVEDVREFFRPLR
jgi:pimeloyl-ACP methyl ester carboxylesterase